MRLLVAIVFALVVNAFVVGSAFAASPAAPAAGPAKPEPAMSEAAAKRLAILEPHAASADVGIQVFLQGSADAAKLRLLGLQNEGEAKEASSARLTNDEMTKLLRHLAAEGFLASAIDGKHAQKAPASPYLLLTIGELSEASPLRAQSVQRLEGIRALLPEKAKAKLDALLKRVRTVAIAASVADQLSKDGVARAASSKALFALGDDALEPLQNAGGRNISPYGEAHINRVDLMYTLIDGIAPNQVPVREGFKTDSFKIEVEKKVTQDDLAKMGERRGFTTSGKFDAAKDPACYVNLKPGKDLAAVLKSILSEEPTVVTVDLHYFK